LSVSAFIYFGITWQHRAKTPEVLQRMHSSFLGVFFREFWFWLTEPLVQFFIFFRITPNMITGLSVIMSLFTGYLFFIGNIGLAGWMVVLSGSMDTFDGRVARATNTSTRSGAFFDACSDRYSDSFVFIGIALFFCTRCFNLPSPVDFLGIDFVMVIVTMMTIAGTGAMSYVKAKGEAMGFNTKRGLMQRPERIATLSVFSCFHPFFKVVADNYGVHPDISLIFVIILMAVLVNFSALVRVVSIFKDIKESEISNE